MSKPLLSDQFLTDPRRHISYHIDGQGFAYPRSPSKTSSSDLLNGFPLPPNLSLKSRTPTPPLPLSRLKYSTESEGDSYTSTLPRPLSQLPQNLLLPPSLPEIQTLSINAARRRSSVTDEELPYHFTFSPSIYTETPTNSYFPTIQSSTNKPLPDLLPPMFPLNSRMERKPSLPLSPPPQAALPHMPSFISVFIDPTTTLVHSSPPTTPIPLPSPTTKSTSSTLDIRQPSPTVFNSIVTGDHNSTERNIVVGKELDSEKDVRTRRRKNASLASKWSFGAGLRNSYQGDGWNQLESELQMEELSRKDEKLRRREDRMEKKIQLQEKKNQILVGESNLNAQDQWSTSSNLHSKRITSPLKTKSFKFPFISKRRIFSKTSLIPIFILMGIILVGIVIAVQLTRIQFGPSTIGNCTCENDGEAKINAEGDCTCRCKGKFIGTYCDFDETCVTLPGTSFPLAQGLLDVASTNTFFSPPINTTRLAFVVNNYLNFDTTFSNCQQHLSLISSPSLPPSRYPRRSTWTNAAILWSIAQRETLATELLSFVSTRNFTPLGDFPLTTPDVNFQIQQSGYIFDFGKLTLSTPAISWISQSTPTSVQKTMSPTSIESEALDIMYSHSLAGATQRNLSLQHIWNELNLSSSDLNLFINAVKIAPVMIPLDATSLINGVDIMSLATNLSTFPPALGCLGGLNNRQTIGLINSVEVTAFGLKSVGASDNVELTCLDRPIYGMINLLSLRLPFLDSDTRSVPTQGLVIHDECKTRMTIHAGELLLGASSGLPSSPSSPSLPDHFSTYTNIESVIFEYLQLLSPNLAKELISFVLQNSQTNLNSLPPSINSNLYQISNKLLSLPIFEIQLFGGLKYSDINYSISSLSTTKINDKTLPFFGSIYGQTFRQWALNGNRFSVGSVQGGLRWSRGALEVNTITEIGLGNAAFETLWSVAGMMKEEEVWSKLVTLATT